MGAASRPAPLPALDARADALWRWLQRAARGPLGVTGAVTLTSVEGYVRADATAGAMAVTLPPAIDMVGVQVQVKKVDASVNAVTVTAAGADLIDGAGTYPLAVQYESVTVRSFGTGWDVV